MEFILTKQFHVQKWWSFFLCFTNHCIALAIQKGFPVPLKPGHISVVCEAPQYSLLPGPFLKHKQIHYILTTFFLTFSMLGIGLKIFDHIFLVFIGRWQKTLKFQHFYMIPGQLFLDRRTEKNTLIYWGKILFPFPWVNAMLLGWWQWFRLSERQKRKAKRETEVGRRKRAEFQLWAAIWIKV